jgi:NADP-dependent 3-hydroxy acid dehydrogenase YdfG
MVKATKDAVAVTGASTGIGKTCTLHLDKLGFQVFAGVRKEADGDALKRRASTRLTPIFLDIADMASIASTADTIATAVGYTSLEEKNLVNRVISKLE